LRKNANNIVVEIYALFLVFWSIELAKSTKS